MIRMTLLDRAYLVGAIVLGAGIVTVSVIGEVLRDCKRMSAFLPLAIVTFVLSGCAEMKPVVRTVNDAVAIVCSTFFASKQGISVADAAKAFCATRAQLDPWLRELLAAQRRAAARFAPDPGASTIYIERNPYESDAGAE